MRAPTPQAKNVSRLRLRITAKAESILRSGHPWLFAESILQQNREGQMGELAVIYDRHDRFLALGLFDPDSPLRARVLHAGKPRRLDRSWWSARLAQALAKRQALFDERTTGFRWINGESDGWPGLVLDRYDHTLVVKLYTAGWLPWLARMIELINEHLQPDRIVLRLSRNIQPRAAQFAHQNGQVIWGPPPQEPVIFLETGLRFEADVLRGQKTGFFLDQRENRRQVEALAPHRNILNAFSFSGAFSLYAARGGANSVTDLDISPHALAGARRNFALNRQIAAVADCHHETVQGDVFQWLAGDTRRSFDLIILDPPSLAKRKSDRVDALRAYGRLTALGIRRLTQKGILVACSCSTHVNANEFFEAVRTAAVQLGRRFTIMQTTRHAPDHPASFEEANYLKAMYLELKTAC